MPETPSSDVTVEQYTSFTDSVRALADACVRTLADADALARAQAEIEAVTARLAADQIPGTQGERSLENGIANGINDWGNTVVGVRNPMALPLDFTFDGEKLSADFFPGAVYEGPPGHMHGGVIALLLDQALGTLAGEIGKPGLTGNLTVDYRRPTKLNTRLRIEAWHHRTEGVKTWTKGAILNADGEVCAEGTGLFILPRWARELPTDDIARKAQRD